MKMSTIRSVLSLNLKIRNKSIFNRTSFSMSLGISTLASCGEVDALPELPAQDEERLQRAARLLQQRLVLRQWLADHGLHSYYQK